MLKLWEKNYILTMTFILLILYGSIFFVSNDSFKKNYTIAWDNTIQTEQSIAYSIQSLMNDDSKIKMTKLNYYCQTMKRQNIYVRICKKQKILANFLPFSVPATKTPTLQMIKHENSHYFCIINSFQYENVPITITYLKSADDIYIAHKKQNRLFLTVSTLISFFLAGILYFFMEKIYQPINNIAHELRTPLTSIQGYAQYILLGRVSTEDILYASSQIDKEAHYINEIIERLLIMANIREGELCYEQLDMTQLLEKLKMHYPSLSIDNHIKYITGDETLLLCLLMNLLSNSSRATGEIRITTSENQSYQNKFRHFKNIHKLQAVKENKICIHNQNDYLDSKMIKILNTNRSIPKEKIHGKGLGVSLCHEIVKLHHGKLIYECSKSKGVTITILLPNAF